MCDDSISIRGAANIVLNSISTIPDLNRLSPINKRVFSYDLAFVALAVRTGYLIDLILLKDPVSDFDALLRILRRTSAFFGDVAHIFDPTSQQSFLVNRTLLRQRLHRLTDIQFVQLPDKDSCQPLQDVPSGVQEIINQLASDLDRHDVPLSVPLRIHDPTDIVSIAAVLIEYPVAYVINPAITSFLHHVRLDVYECIVECNSRPAHTLLKFSCPAILGEMYPDRLSPRRMKVYLERHFGSENRLGRWNEAGLQVLHSTGTHDRVAL